MSTTAVLRSSFVPSSAKPEQLRSSFICCTTLFLYKQRGSEDMRDRQYQSPLADSLTRSSFPAFPEGNFFRFHLRHTHTSPARHGRSNTTYRKSIIMNSEKLNAFFFIFAHHFFQEPIPCPFFFLLFFSLSVPDVCFLDPDERCTHAACEFRKKKFEKGKNFKVATYAPTCLD